MLRKSGVPSASGGQYSCGKSKEPHLLSLSETQHRVGFLEQRANGKATTRRGRRMVTAAEELGEESAVGLRTLSFDEHR